MECSICFQNLNEDDVFTSSCQHQFCQSCILEWFKKNANCPLCRKYIFEEIPQYYELNVEIIRRLLVHLIIVIEQKQFNTLICIHSYYTLLDLLDVTIRQFFENNIETSIQEYNRFTENIDNRYIYSFNIVDLRKLFILVMNNIQKILIQQDIDFEKLNKLKFNVLFSKLSLEKEICNSQNKNKNEFLKIIIDKLSSLK
jgi:hypothetical protein